MAIISESYCVGLQYGDPPDDPLDTYRCAQAGYVGVHARPFVMSDPPSAASIADSGFSGSEANSVGTGVNTMGGCCCGAGAPGGRGGDGLGGNGNGQSGTGGGGGYPVGSMGGPSGSSGNNGAGGKGSGGNGSNGTPCPSPDLFNLYGLLLSSGCGGGSSSSGGAGGAGSSGSPSVGTLADIAAATALAGSGVGEGLGLIGFLQTGGAFWILVILAVALWAGRKK